MGLFVQRKVARWNRHRGRRIGGRGDLGRRADAQAIRGVAGGRRPERFGQRHPERGAESGPPAFFALLIIGHRFPLEGQEGGCSIPYAKSLTVVIAGCWAITLDPASRLTLAGISRHDWGAEWWGRLIGPALRSEIDPPWKSGIVKPPVDLQLPAGAIARVAPKGLRSCCGSNRGCHYNSGLPPPAHGVHSLAGRRRSAVHALHRLRHFDHRGKAAAANSDAHLKSQPEVARVLGTAG